ncbi:CHAT domain-containing protein [Anatilimnocola floriformis]|uniref:CHAT domain-containing protein n=1 Tax=Anatilimnocola floriformis TaxID=2948575 RepID=UPI0020C48B82|nr:CHAT domain-containing protein [Anatilimnocola floriformis]
MRCRHICSLLIALAFLTMSLRPTRAQEELDAETYNSILRAVQVANDNGRYKEAERYARQIKANDERYDPQNFIWRLLLGLSIKNQSRFEESRPLLESYVELCKKTYGDEIRTVEGLTTLGGLYVELDLLDKATAVLEEGLKMGVRTLGPDDDLTLAAQGNLALVYQSSGDWTRAVPMYRDIINRQHRLNRRELMRLNPICNLVLLYQSQGRFDLAESLTHYGLGLAKSFGLPTKHPKVITLLERLALSYQKQHRLTEALSILKQALQAAEGTLDANSAEIGSLCHNLSACYSELGDREKSRPFSERSIAIHIAVFGADHPRLCAQYGALGWDLINDEKYAEAETVLRRGLEIADRVTGVNAEASSALRTILGNALFLQGKLDDADKLLQQAVRDLEALGSDQNRRHDALRLQAQVQHERGDKPGAIRLLQKAIEVADASRVSTSGGEFERASYYSKFNYSHELLAAWQAELGETAAVFAAFEQARARTFLESMNQAGIDLWAGLSVEAKARGQEQQIKLTSRVSQLNTQWLELPVPSPREDAAVDQQRRQLARDLLIAKDSLYEFERNLRNSSQAYRQLIATQPKVFELSAVQQRLVGEKTLLLSYFVGYYNSYLLAISPTSAQLHELVVSERDAATLGLIAGPLTREDLQKVLLGDGKTGVLQRLASKEPLGDAEAKLHGLWNALLPEQLRGEVTGGKLEKLIVVPDGPLSLLPLEALIVERSPTVYLLDVAPPIEYTPSAAVLMTLTERPAVATQKEPVLTLGNPLYNRGDKTRSTHTPLPFTGTESRWVAETYRKANAPAVQFQGATATEANIRANISGREIIHLACHGSSDNTYGNFFGSLSVAPGQKVGDPQDDGELTLAEINSLDLKGCELAILSACLTNHGPQQQGEGVWALSRGFLVAGARRVVASDWIVDDAAAGSLISIFCSRLAQDRQAKKTADYSQALRDAKRWTRNQEKWQQPYYWAPFVFVGPK